MKYEQKVDESEFGELLFESSSDSGSNDSQDNDIDKGNNAGLVIQPTDPHQGTTPALQNPENLDWENYHSADSWRCTENEFTGDPGNKGKFL